MSAGTDYFETDGTLAGKYDFTLAVIYADDLVAAALGSEAGIPGLEEDLYLTFHRSEGDENQDRVDLSRQIVPISVPQDNTSLFLELFFNDVEGQFEAAYSLDGTNFIAPFDPFDISPLGPVERFDNWVLSGVDLGIFVPEVPIPASFALFASGLVGLGLSRRRRRVH